LRQACAASRFRTPLVARRLHGSEQHDIPADEREQEHVLHGDGRLVHDLAHLREQRIDVDDRDLREQPHELRERPALLGATCTLVISVPVTSSSTPGENTTKKFGWNESQRTSRRLVTRPLTFSPRRRT
jgi:hypothetical protein